MCVNRRDRGTVNDNSEAPFPSRRLTIDLGENIVFLQRRRAFTIREHDILDNIRNYGGVDLNPKPLLSADSSSPVVARQS